MSDEATTPKKTKVERPANAQGLAADAKLSKKQNTKQDEAQAAEHEELRESGKIEEPTPILGYDTARENMFSKKDERVEPEMPEANTPEPKKGE